MYLRRGLCKLIQNFVSNPLDFLSLNLCSLLPCLQWRYSSGMYCTEWSKKEDIFMSKMHAKNVFR